MAKRRKRPPLIPERTIPPDTTTRLKLIGSLTRTIKATQQHLLTPHNHHDNRQRRVLEALINERSRVLERLGVETPASWQQVCVELGLSIERSPL